MATITPRRITTPASLVGGALAAFGATACCSGPLLLMMLGFGGASAARMASLEPLQPWFIGLTVLFMGFAFYRLYLRPRRCAPGETCEAPPVLRRQRVAFWIVVALIASMTIFTFFAG